MFQYEPNKSSTSAASSTTPGIVRVMVVHRRVCNGYTRLANSIATSVHKNVCILTSPTTAIAFTVPSSRADYALHLSTNVDSTVAVLYLGLLS